MNLTEEVYGSLLFLRKDGQLGTTYPLYNGEITIGSSRDADIRFKLHDKRLEDIHCIIEVNEDGIATLLNKSILEPVKINSVSISNTRILRDNDEIELIGKKFRFVNENTKKNSDSHQKCLSNARSTISKKRHSLISLKSAKKPANFKTKIPIQRRPSTRKFVSSTSSDFMVTHEKEPVIDRCKTMSKVIVSKALGSPGSSRKRRLSFGDSPKKFAKSPRMSARNILLCENTLSYSITEEKSSVSPKLSVSNTKSRKQSGTWIQKGDSSDLSQDESVKLNLSSNSSVSPVSSSPRRSLNYSSKKSLSRKSSRKSHLQEEKISKTLRNSLLKQCLEKNQERSLTHSRESLRKSNTGENQFSEEILQSPESHPSNKSSRQSLRKSIRVKREKQLEASRESPALNISNKTSRGSRKSLMKDIEWEEKHDEEQSSSESENACVATTRATPKQRASVEYNSTMNNDEYYADSSRGELSVSLSKLGTRNGTTPKERRSSTNLRGNKNQVRKSSLNGSIINKEASTPKETSSRSTTSKTRELSLRKSVGLNEVEVIEELSSSEESLVLSLSPMNTNEECIQRPTMSPKKIEKESIARKSYGINDDAEFNELSSNEEILVSNISPLNNTKETSIQSQLVTPRDTASSVRMSKKRGSLVRRGAKSNQQQFDELSFDEESFNPDVSALNNMEEIERSAATPKVISMRPSNEKSSARKSNRLSKNEDIVKLSSSEESLQSNALEINTAREKSVQRQLTTPKDLNRSVSKPEERKSSMRKSNILKRNEEIENASSSEESVLLNTSVNSLEDTYGQEFSTTSTEAVTSKKPTTRRSSMRTSNRLNDSKEINLLSSQESLISNTSAVNSPKELSVQKTSPTTPKQIITVARTPKERVSSVRRNKVEKHKELSSSEEFIQRLSTATPKEKVTLARNSKKKSSSGRKNNRDEEIGEVFSDEEFFIQCHSTMNSPNEKSIQRLSTTPKDIKASVRISRQRGSSVGRSEELNISEKMGQLSSSENSLELNVSAMNNSEESLQNQSVPRKTRRSKSLNRDSLISYAFNKNSTPISPTNRESIGNQIYERSFDSSQSESDLSVDSPQGSNTPKLRHSSVRKNQLKTKEENEIEHTFNKSLRSNASSTKRSYLNTSAKSGKTKSITNISVITLNDSVEGTPENNMSVIIVDTPLEKPRKSHKLSKTLNSNLQDDIELTTPKSAIKSRRTKSLPYNPLTEEITPVTPLSKSKNESGFKTPLNTPGLFENIKKSVLKSRSQMQKSSTNLMEELNKVEPKKKGLKRPRESKGSSAESSKRRKYSTSDEIYSTSFESFTTDDVLPDISGQIITQITPKHFSDLTDKPVVTHPQVRSFIEPKKRKSSSKILDSELSSTDDTTISDSIISGSSIDSSSEQNDSVIEDVSDVNSSSSSRRSLRTRSSHERYSPVTQQKSPKNDLSDVAGLKKLLKTPRKIKSPKNDLTDVKGVKRLLRTPNVKSSPKNDLTNVPNLRRLISPKIINSPKNDLRNIIGVKKLLATPKQMKSPKNDLRYIPNLKKLISPKQQNSPKNDLSDVAGLKKLLSTPKEVKSPKNDLRNVPNLRKLMSPKKETSPKNDLTNVPNLRRIMSPKQQNSPKNDLTDVRGLKKLMGTPRERKEPQNDLRDVDGVANIFNISGVERLSIESDIENNENLFDKIFSRKPLKTYRGKSLSPASRKATIFDDKRKTLGDLPYMSPRVEKWIEEQAVIKLKNSQDTNDNDDDEETTTNDKITEVVEQPPKRTIRRTEKAVIKDIPKTDELMNKNVHTDESEIDDKRKINQISDDEVKLVKKPTRGRRKVNEDKQKFMTKKTSTVDKERSNEIGNRNNHSIDEINNISEKAEIKIPTVKPCDSADKIPEVQRITEDVKSSVPDRGIGMRAVQQEEYTEVVVPSPRRGGRRRNPAQVETGACQEESKEELPQPSRVRGKRKDPVKKDEESGNESDVKFVGKKEARPKRGRGKRVMNTDEVIVTVVSDEEQVEQIDNTPIVTKRTRGRKQNTVESDVDQNVEETFKATVGGKAGNKKGGRSKTKVEDTKVEDIQTEADIVKSTRSRKKATIKVDVLEDNKEEEKGISEVKKNSRTKKKAGETNNAEGEKEIPPSKPTRRKRLAENTTETVEEKEIYSELSEVVKKVGRGKKTTEVETKDVEVEVTSVRPTRGRKQPKIITEKILEESVPVDSPRTARAKRGNFNKYGSDFLTECDSDKNDTKTKRHVHFAEIEDNKNKKRRGRNVATTEVIENVEVAIRRSKRNRK